MLFARNDIEQQCSSNHMEYRKDIQGLRAIAILLVIAAHAKIPGLEGGFTGVDIFFVISGYLITGLLAKELASTNTINLRRFYARRLKRLLPTLATVVGVSSIAAHFMLPAMEQQPQATAAATAILWISNIYFAFQQLDYFGSQVESNIFLHTWSLGVEEQFYLIWPLIIISGYWFASRKNNPQKVLVAIFATLTLLSFAFCVWKTNHDARSAFYLTPFRAWQFSVGALVFLLGDKLKLLNSRQASILWITGFLLVLACSITLNKSYPYPGFLAAIPTLGAALLIASGINLSQNAFKYLLENKPVHLIGNISYSWYLWHWPVLCLGGLIFPPSEIYNQLLLVIFSLLLAYITHHTIENPIRFHKKLNNYYGWQIIAALVIMFSINIGSIRWHNQQAPLVETQPQDWFIKAKLDLPEIYGTGCDDWFQSSDVKICQFGTENAQQHIIMMGDSIGLQWFPAIYNAFLPKGWRISVITKSSCPMADVPFFYERIRREYTECSEWRRKALNIVQDLSSDILILGSANYSFSPEEWREGTAESLNTVTNSAAYIYIIRPTPTLPFDAVNCLSAPNLNLNQCSAKIDLKTNTQGWQSVTDVASSYNNVYLIDMNNLICPNQTCSAGQRDMPIYRDNMHLTASFITSMSEQLLSEMKRSASPNSIHFEKIKNQPCQS